MFKELRQKDILTNLSLVSEVLKFQMTDNNILAIANVLSDVLSFDQGCTF